ncbi:YitT family protein [Pseudothauera nasutitermitis]|uniref:YitT family protein n=1 Tax=Pseudothauera nasutitermitis TaxID=2565930 RepID=A0A4S4B261_9RHOO|nr:YitT family protein [Pseudothauera nasutitermitis]THF66569.1 YitT family protein [Pseudothauera nasutitermitis]
MSAPNPAAPRHTLFEDIQGLLAGTLFVALAVLFFKQAGLLFGGTAGLTLLAHYATGWNFGLLYFFVSMPFYVFAVRALGWAFTIKTFFAVALLSVLSELLPHFIHLDWMHPVFAALMGGQLAGAGLLMLIRHQSSLGGVGVLAVWLQRTRGWNAGTVQLVADALILSVALIWLSPWLVAISALGAVAVNMVIAINHRPGRYFGV